MIGHGKTDIVAMGRQMLADPETGRKVRENRVEEIRPCINCYVCVAQPFFDRRVKCAVNPVLARESELGAVESTPAETSKKIVVVGGGPAGLEVARVATLRGHYVTVFEAARNIGGALRFAALLYEPNLRLLRWYEHEMRRLAVDIRTATTATPRRLLRSRPIMSSWRPERPAPARRCPEPTAHTSSTATTSASCSPAPAPPGGEEASVAGSSCARIGRRVGLIDDPGILAKLTEQYMPVGKRVVIIGGGSSAPSSPSS